MANPADALAGNWSPAMLIPVMAFIAITLTAWATLLFLKKHGKIHKLIQAQNANTIILCQNSPIVCLAYTALATFFAFLAIKYTYTPSNNIPIKITSMALYIFLVRHFLIEVFSVISFDGNTICIRKSPHPFGAKTHRVSDIASIRIRCFLWPMRTFSLFLVNSKEFTILPAPLNIQALEKHLARSWHKGPGTPMQTKGVYWRTPQE